MKNVFKIILVGLGSLFLLAGCAKQSAAVTTNDSVGLKMTQILGSTNWKGTKAYDKEGNDLSKENANFLGLALYDAKTSQYEFFDKETKKTRGDRGTYFVTNDGKIRVLISKTYKYQAIVTITELNQRMFTYKRVGKDAKGNSVEIFVDHIPYTETKLTFTQPEEKLTKSTGIITRDIDGDKILSSTLWQGTKALDKEGKDVTAYNKNYIGIAKYDYLTNKYEFFNAQTGKSRGDYGYYDVFNNNKVRAHVSQGYKYGAVLELTELNRNKFTYTRMGKDQNENEIEITVEHIPYRGNYTIEFTH